MPSMGAAWRGSDGQDRRGAVSRRRTGAGAADPCRGPANSEVEERTTGKQGAHPQGEDAQLIGAFRAPPFPTSGVERRLDVEGSQRLRGLTLVAAAAWRSSTAPRKRSWRNFQEPDPCRASRLLRLRARSRHQVVPKSTDGRLGGAHERGEISPIAFRDRADLLLIGGALVHQSLWSRVEEQRAA
jgi:hypothetical protein